MKGRIAGILLSLAGITSLIWAFITVNSTDDSHHIAELICGTLGAIAFFVGIRLVPDPRAASREEIKVLEGHHPGGMGHGEKRHS